MAASDDSITHFNVQPGADPDGAGNDFYYFGGLVAVSAVDVKNLSNVQAGIFREDGVLSPITQKNSYGLESLALPVPGQTYLGFPPLPNASLALQEAYEGGPNGPISQIDMEFILAGRGQDFTPAQVGALSMANKYALAVNGYFALSRAGALGSLASGQTLQRLIMTMGLTGAGRELSAATVNQLIALGPVGLTPNGDGLTVSGVFNVTDVKGLKYQSCHSGTKRSARRRHG